MRDLQNRRDFFRGLKTHKVQLGKGVAGLPNARLVRISAERHHRVMCVSVHDVKVHGNVK